jgi:hypothetical protein
MTLRRDTIERSSGMVGELDRSGGEMVGPAGWYPDPASEDVSTAQLRYWNGKVWTKDTADTADVAVGPSPERIEPWALVISLLPLVGIVGGAISIARGKRRNGRLMILIGLGSLLLLSLLRA